MVTVRGEILIGRSMVEVYDFVADERNEPTFNPAMVRVDKITPGPIARGTRFGATVTSRGRPTDMVVEITEFERPTRLGTATTMASAKIRGALTFAPAEAGTRMAWTWDVEPIGVPRLLSPVVGWMGRRQEKATWTSLKRHLESRPPQGD